MGMADVLDRIQKLLSLAVNNSEGEEGRSAAMRAATLILEHKVQLSLPSVGTSPRVVASCVVSDDAFDEMLRTAAERVRAASAGRPTAWERLRDQREREQREREQHEAVRARVRENMGTATAPPRLTREEYEQWVAKPTKPLRDTSPTMPDYDPFDFDSLNVAGTRSEKKR